MPADLPYRAILRALRGHPSPQTEALLLLAARDWDPTFRAAAVSSLGWWEPIQRPEVLLTLQDARRDPSPEVRHAARAALGRLGERQALLWFRQTLSSEDPQRVYDTIQSIAAEGLTLLWPDLDKLAEVEDSDVTHHAREALERMSEEMERGMR
jgi:HEAT repeat protein